MSKPSLQRSVTLPRGFRAAGGTCGIKPSGKADLALIVADQPCTAAAVFTKNKMPGAPVIVGKKHVRNGSARAIVCNSGISNVCTGTQGIEDARTMCEILARCIGNDCAAGDVLPSSTGVIGHLLPMDKIRVGIPAVAATLARGAEADAIAARSIMTTDLVPKSANRTCILGGKKIRLGGIAKGSGMIAPNMATMLVFITTDAAIHAGLLKQALQHAVNHSFNRISVDHDTSTSDSVQILASGLAGNTHITRTGKTLDIFTDALTDLCQDLAYQIVADGEGATKVFRVIVKNARSTRDADRIGHTVTGSPLVKTAVHGGDPNWGRLVMAIGRSGAAVKPDRVNIAIASVEVCRRGAPVPLTTAQQKKLDKLMAAREITFHIDMGLGKGEAQWLSCDLSREYIAINADYTT